MIIVTAINNVAYSDDNARKPVDFSVSLECRALEGPFEQFPLASVRDYEQAYAQAKRDGNWGEINNNPAFKGTIYDESVRIALNHGEIDGGSFGFLVGAYVKEVTPEHIYFVADDTPVGPVPSGDIDRRTGHGSMVKYRLDTRNSKGGDWTGVTRTFFQSFDFECAPSPPA